MTDTVVVTELTNGIVEVVVQGPQGPAGLGDVAAGGVLAGSYPNPTFAASPAFTGTPTAPTATAGTATTQIATTAFVGTAVDNLINAAPGALNTLDELAAALGDDANFATTVTNSLALKEATANKDASGGYAGLTLFKLNLKNAANTITSWFTTAATVARTWTMPDKDGTVAMTSDITGVNSGTNTGDQTTITGNAGTATALQTARTIGGSSFDGTANVTSFPSPGAIGGTTPAAGAFTTVSFSSTLTGSGSSAGVEVGAKGTANSPYIDFNSSGNSNDYDVRVQATGGTTVGTGNLNVTASLLAVSGTISATGITVATGLTATGANSGLDIGAKLSVNTPFIDFNSSGNSNDYDARLIASGGTTIGTGTLTYNGALFSVAGNLTATGNATLGDAEATDTHSIKGATTLLANSASAALTVTQTGAGNAFVVEDSASTDSTPFVIDGSGNLFKGYGSSISVEYPMGFQINGTGADAGVSMTRWAANTGSPSLYIAKSRGASVATRAIVLSGDSLASINFSGDDGTNFITGARVAAEVDGTPGTNDMPGRLVFSTTADGASSPTEAMRIDSKQNVGIGGAAPAYTKLSFAGTLASGSGFGRTVDAVGTVPSTTTTDHTVFQSNPYTQAAAFTLSALSHFVAVPGTFGAGSTVSNQFGFQAASNLTGATNNYGFYSNIASAANRYNFYAAGTATNYFAGPVTSSSYFSTSDVIGLKNATAIPAGGTFALGMSSTNTMGLYFGSGAPTVSAAKGSIYLRSDGTTTNDRMYVNTNGSTTWTAIVTVA